MNKTDDLTGPDSTRVIGPVFEPLKNGFCKECHFYTTLNNGSRVCGLNVHKPVRKIERCDDYISNEYRDEIEAEYLEKYNRLVKGDD